MKNDNPARTGRPRRSNYSGNVKAIIDATNPAATFVRFDLQKKVLLPQWNEWRILLAGNNATPGVEGVVDAKRENVLTITLSLGGYFMQVAMAKKVAREAASTLKLKLTAIEVKRHQKSRG